MRKLPPDMDYKTIRHSHPPGRKGRPRRPGKDTALSGETEASRTDPAIEPAETPQLEEMTPAASVQTSPEPREAAAPRAESEPVSQENAKAAEPAPGPTDTGEVATTQDATEPPVEIFVEKRVAARETAPLQPAKKASKTPARHARKTDISTEPSTERDAQVAMVGYIQIPAEGAFESFDELARLYGVRDALGFAMTAALRDFDDALLSGQHVRTVQAYTPRKGRLSIRRTISDAAYRRAVAAIDPRGLMGSWQVTSRIFRAALALHLAKDGPAGISSRAS